MAKEENGNLLVLNYRSLEDLWMRFDAVRRILRSFVSNSKSAGLSTGTFFQVWSLVILEIPMVILTNFY